MTLSRLVELLEECSESVETHGFILSQSLLTENIECVVQELEITEQRDELADVISGLERSLHILENIQSEPLCGQNGRPKIFIPNSSLRYLLITMNLKICDIAKIFFVNRKTITRRLREINLSVSTRSYNIYVK